MKANEGRQDCKPGFWHMIASPPHGPLVLRWIALGDARHVLGEVLVGLVSLRWFSLHIGLSLYVALVRTHETCACSTHLQQFQNMLLTGD